MKRIILMLTVAAFMVAALAVTSAGAFAAPDRTDDKQCKGGNPNCVTANPGGQPKGASQTDQFKPGP